MPHTYSGDAGRGGPNAQTAREVYARVHPKDLAERLVVSENTVKFHLRNILDKLHFLNRAKVIAYALKQRLAEPPD